MNPIYDFPCKGDPNIYINIAKEMLNGSVLYRDVFDHKGPFIFFVYLIPNLLKNANMGLFLIDVVMFNVITYFNIKTIKLTNNHITACLFVSVEIVLLLCSYITASPELISLAIISYANYWILSGRYKQPQTFELIFAGMLVGILFWVKYTLTIYLAVVFLYFIIKNAQWKNVYLPIIGFTIPTIIVFLYFLYNHAVRDLIYCYFIINLGYQSTDLFVFTPALTILLATIICIGIMAIVKKTSEFLILALAHLALTITVFFMTGYVWTNLFTPFISVVSLLSIFDFNKCKKIVIALLVFISLLLGYMLYTSSIGNIAAAKAYNQLNDFADNINETGGTIMVFQTEPVLPWEIEEIGYKYFFAPTLTYEQLPEMYEKIFEDISNQNIDYVVVLLNENGEIMPLSHFRTATEGELVTLEWVKKIASEIYENYEVFGKYYQFTVFKAKEAM